MDECLACELMEPVDDAFNTIFDFIDARHFSIPITNALTNNLAFVRMDLHEAMGDVHDH